LLVGMLSSEPNRHLGHRCWCCPTWFSLLHLMCLFYDTM
jgi:hypothetical protein